MSQAVILGGVLGLGVGFGLYALRLKQWKLLWSLAIVVLGLAGVGLAGAVLLVGGGLFRGGDAFMASATFFLFGGVGLVASLGVMLVVGLVQNVTVRQSFFRCSTSLILDILALASLVWGYQAMLWSQQRAVTDQWWQLEQQRRNERKAELERIPQKYRMWTLPMIDAQRKQERQMAQAGVAVQSPLPKEVENAIRNYEYGSATSVQPIPDRSGYADLANQSKGFLRFLAMGWLAGAVLLPLGNRLLRGDRHPSG